MNYLESKNPAERQFCKFQFLKRQKKPLILTNIGDLSEILDGCGWIVESGRPNELAKTIQYVLENPKEAGK